MEKSNIIEALKERIDSLEKWRKEKKKPPKAPKEDEDVCPQCGSDLVWVEEGITYCEKCKQYYEETKADDE